MRPTHPYRWARPGDINAFFGLMFDNLANLMLLVLLLSAFGLPAEFSIKSMVPGTALGVMIGDLAFFALAFRLARRSDRSDVTAMPLGIDTPSLFGMVFFVLGPSYVAGREALGLDEFAAATRTWHIGIWCVVLSGLLKLACAPICGRIRAVVPRAGLLGSLAAIALVVISFMPMLKIFAHPLPGLLALVIVLTSLIGRIPLPGRLPGTLGALIVAGIVYYLMIAFKIDGYHRPVAPSITWFPTDWIAAWAFGWIGDFPAALSYLPIAFPFALMTVVGGIDCTESAAAAGDDYDTRGVIAIEGAATLFAGLSGGVIQTTPYIGHPAYKAMGGRAAYSLATALFIGSAGILGYFGIINAYLPVPVVLPILVFIGLEITAQSFAATPRRHYPAVALSCIPAVAFLSLYFPTQLFGDSLALSAGLSAETVSDPHLRGELQTVRMLSNSFILTSLLWAWTLAAVIDRRLLTASLVLCVTAVFTLFGVIHSPLAENRLFVLVGPEAWGDWVLAPELRGMTVEYAAGYLASAGLLALWGWVLPADLGPADEHGHESETRLLTARVLEPEVMDSVEEAIVYDEMDHDAVNERFVQDFFAGGDPGREIVDLGSGPAHIPIKLCRRSEDCRVMAIDASAAMLDIARRNIELAQLTDRVQLEQADCKSLAGFPEAMADSVISNSLIHHLAEPITALRAAVRITRPGGRIFIRDLARPATAADIERLTARYTGSESPAAQAMFRDSLLAALSLDEARAMAAACGFDPQSVTMTSDRHWTLDARRPDSV